MLWALRLLSKSLQNNLHFRELFATLGGPRERGNCMASKKKAPTYSYLEQWDTRNGLSERIVLRRNGKFVDNISLTALKQGTRVQSR